MRLRISSLRRFEKTFENQLWKKKHSYAANATLHLFTWTIWENIWKLTLEKVIEMQPMRLCICFGRQCEKTFENSLWRKIVHMQPTRLRICSLRWFEKTFETHTGIKSLKCNQCDYAPVLAGNWKRKLTLEKNCSNSTNATSHLFTQTIWENIWKLTLEKVIEMQPMRLCICFGR